MQDRGSNQSIETARNIIICKITMLFDLNFCICAFYVKANTGMFTFLFARNLSAGIVIRIYIHDVVFLV